MRIVLAVLGVLFVVTILAQPAEARRGSTKQQELFFVTDTKIQQNGEAFSLCHLVTTHSALFVNFWRSIDSYVLSKKKCEGTEYLNIKGFSIEQLKADDLIPKDIPSEPKLSVTQILYGFWGMGLLAISLIIIIIRVTITYKRRATRQKAFAIDDPFTKNLLEVMCHAAMADGQVDASEIDLIQKNAQKLAGRKFSKEQIAELIKSCDKNPSDFTMKSFGKGMDLDQKAKLLMGAIAVVTVDSDLDKKEHKFINSFISKVGIPPKIAEQILTGK